MENEAGRFTLIFLGVPGDEGGEVELTYNWDESGYDGGRNFGHLAYQVDDIYETCRRLMDNGVTINRPPRDGRMAFVRIARRDFDRAAAEGRRARPGGAVGVDAQHGRMVMLEIVAVPAFTDNYFWLVHDRGERRNGGGGPRRRSAGPEPRPPRGLDDRRRCWNTHWHPDHTGGNLAIKQATGAPISRPPKPSRSPGRRRRPERRRRASPRRGTSAG